MVAAIKAGYLRGCPGLTEAAVRKYINVEPATEMDHMKLVPVGRRSITKKSNRGRTPKENYFDKNDAIEIPK